MSSRTAFISGPTDPDPEYFSLHYQPAILAALSAGDSFVIGPVPGIDTLALSFLLAQKVPSSRLTVYLTKCESRYHIPRLEELGVNYKIVEGSITQVRDAAMTRVSDYDILKYRSEKEAKEFYGKNWIEYVTNTELNERRRKAWRDAGRETEDDVSYVKPSALEETQLKSTSS
jgi:hypothetical protein